MRDVGMVQRRENLRFPFETAEPIGVVGKGGGQYLDRDVAIEPGIARAIDLAHAAGAEGREDFIGTEARAGGQGQAVSWIIGASRPRAWESPRLAQSS